MKPTTKSQFESTKPNMMVYHYNWHGSFETVVIQKPIRKWKQLHKIATLMQPLYCKQISVSEAGAMTYEYWRDCANQRTTPSMTIFKAVTTWLLLQMISVHCLIVMTEIIISDPRVAVCIIFLLITAVITCRYSQKGVSDLCATRHTLSNFSIIKCKAWLHNSMIKLCFLWFFNFFHTKNNNLKWRKHSCKEKQNIVKHRSTDMELVDREKTLCSEKTR